MQTNSRYGYEETSELASTAKILTLTGTVLAGEEPQDIWSTIWSIMFHWRAIGFQEVVCSRAMHKWVGEQARDFIYSSLFINFT